MLRGDPALGRRLRGRLQLGFVPTVLHTYGYSWRGTGEREGSVVQEIRCQQGRQESSACRSKSKSVGQWEGRMRKKMSRKPDWKQKIFRRKGRRTAWAALEEGQACGSSLPADPACRWIFLSFCLALWGYRPPETLFCVFHSAMRGSSRRKRYFSPV